MYFQLDLVCFYFYFVLQIIYVTAFTTRLRHFKISKRNPTINQCASTLLPKNGWNGLLRVSESTGQCEQISAPVEEENVEPGYNYAKQLTAKTSFHPPINLQNEDTLNMNSSVDSLTRISLYTTWPKDTWDLIYIGLVGDIEASGWENHIVFRIRDYINKMTVFEAISNYEDMLVRYYEDNLPGTECNVTFTADENNVIKVLFNGKSMVAWKVQRVRFYRLDELGIWYREKHPVKGRVFPIHGVEFISKG